MKTVSVDLSKLLGYRLAVSEAVANGERAEDYRGAIEKLSVKTGAKDGEKVGNKEGRKGGAPA